VGYDHVPSEDHAVMEAAEQVPPGSNGGAIDACQVGFPHDALVALAGTQRYRSE
jgi:hypothetical protein